MRFLCVLLIGLVALPAMSEAQGLSKRSLAKPGGPAVGAKKQTVKPPAGPRIKAVDPVVKPPPPKRVNPGGPSVKTPTLVTPPKVKSCPRGTTGKWPNCRDIVQTCPKGTTGKWPNCRTIAQACPKGTTGKWPNCIKIAKPGGDACPAGQVRKGKRCIDIAKPNGGGGKGCPSGQVRKGKSCVDVAEDDSGKGKGSSDKTDTAKSGSDKADPGKSDQDKGSPPPKATATTRVAIPPAVAALVTDRPHRPREILVLVDAARADEIAARLAREHNVTAEPQVPVALLDGVIVQLRLKRGQSLESLLAAIDADPDIEAAQPNYDYRASKGPVPRESAYYAGKKIRLEEAHRLARGQGVIVAVIDTAIEADHPELAGAVADTFDAVGGGAARPDPHGTQIAGILAARDKLQGVAPEAKLLGVRAFSGAGKASPAQSTTLQVLKGIDWAFASRAKVMNMSFAGPMDPLLERAIKAAAQKGTIFVAAAGNNGPKAAPAYPAAYADVIAVTAVDEDDKLYAKANRGEYILVAAPGVDIAVPALKRRYGIASGTSMAAAHVSGVVALLLQRDTGLTADEIRTILSSSARKLAEPPDDAIGAGVLDAASAVTQGGETEASETQPPGTLISSP